MLGRLGVLNALLTYNIFNLQWVYQMQLHHKPKSIYLYGCYESPQEHASMFGLSPLLLVLATLIINMLRAPNLSHMYKHIKADNGRKSIPQ